MLHFKAKTEVFVDTANFTFVATRTLTSHIAVKYLLWFLRLLPAPSRPRDSVCFSVIRVTGADEQDQAASSGSRSRVIPRQEEERELASQVRPPPDR